MTARITPNPMTAAWLRRLGHEAVIVEGGVSALTGLEPRAAVAPTELPKVREISPLDLDQMRQDGQMTILDLRTSDAYRAGHVPGAIWAIRPRLPDQIAPGPCVLVADTRGVAQLAAKDLAEAGTGDISALEGGFAAWTGAGLEIEATPDSPPDAERIDFLSFTHGRHAGNEQASRQYLAWEIALVAQLDADERAVFRI